MNRSFLKLAVALLIIILTLHLLFYEIYDCKCSKGKLQDLEISTNIPTMKIHRSYDEKCWVPRPYLDNLCKCYPEGLGESSLNNYLNELTINKCIKSFIKKYCQSMFKIKYIKFLILIVSEKSLKVKFRIDIFKIVYFDLYNLLYRFI